MTTLDDLERVERELRDGAATDFAMETGTGNYLFLWADTIAAFIAAQRERDAERDALRAEVALRKSEVELFRDELKARCDEVAKLSAAAAQMREALRILDGFVEPRPSAAEWTGICEMARNLKAALSTNADGNYVGVTGALEGKP